MYAYIIMAFDLSKISSLFTSEIAKVQKRTAVGLDIGSSAIKIVQLNDTKGIPTLETYGELQLGPYENVEIGRTTHLPAGKLVEAFVDIMREASATATNIACAISYNSSFSTIISVATTDAEKIGTMIPVEAKKYVPVPLNEVTLDWFPVSAKSESKATKILLAAIHNDALKKYEAVINGAGLHTLFTEVEIFSTIRSAIAQGDETVAIIDIGAGSTKLYLVHKGVVGKTHSVLMSGVELTNAVAKATNLDFRQAEEKKRRDGLLAHPDDLGAQKALIAVLERGLRELHKVMARYEEDEGVQVSKIVLSGSGALLNGLPAYVSEMLARPVTIADPFAKVAYPAFLEDTLKDAGPAFAVAVGAALRGLASE